jgi:hypothetical protein
MLHMLFVEANRGQLRAVCEVVFYPSLLIPFVVESLRFRSSACVDVLNWLW